MKPAALLQLMPSIPSRVPGLLAACWLTACANIDTSDVAGAEAGLAHSGHWEIPSDVLAAAATQQVTLTEAGPWTGTSGCSGTFTSGARTFGAYLLRNFPQITSYGGYSCRPIVGESQYMSVHATGRALDLFIPVDRSVSGEGNADNDAGDPVANWLIANAQYIGIQRVIWDRWLWQSEDYGEGQSQAYDFAGSNPHNDHIHMELSVEAAQQMTAFFQGSMEAPMLTGCAALPSEGGVVDNGTSCFQAFGNSTYWRRVEGAGIGGSYLWTNATSATSPSNWARWSLNLASAGRYEVEVHLVADHAVFSQARYGITHDGVSDTATLDQSASSEWVVLGEYDFVAGGAQSVEIYDNATGTVASGQNVCVDAIRVTNLSPPSGDSPADNPWGDGGSGASPSSPRVQNPGCSTTGASSSGRAPFALFVVLAGLAAWKRSRKRVSPLA